MHIILHMLGCLIIFIDLKANPIMLSNSFDDPSPYDHQSDVYCGMKPEYQYEDMFAAEGQNYLEDLDSPGYGEFADYPRLFDEQELDEGAAMAKDGGLDDSYVRRCASDRTGMRTARSCLRVYPLATISRRPEANWGNLLAKPCVQVPNFLCVRRARCSRLKGKKSKWSLTLPSSPKWRRSGGE
eukprot:TRINITY_DN1406_c0_g3_i3.p2 TRINITY_DN1406_c0_g3~~TRINITY_DN1406_c0_g3_i3.p2  ORF type:complete len:184 (+),score=21.27 TRINITY_DN1406_c0_g3_i3:131-682(+)